MKILVPVALTLALLFLAVALYEQYGDTIRQRFFAQEDTYIIHVNQTVFTVSVADDDAERKQGLSGVPSLGKFEGKLFILDTPAKQGIWMHDMQFPIDILWFNESFELIHVESNVSPDTYPAVFAPPTEARFVLELNALAASTYALPLGSRLSLPAALVPGDLKHAF
jgi:uncharacterized membrane protein (UPF0127 family)